MSESEPSDDASKTTWMTSELGSACYPRMSMAGESRAWPCGVRRKGGMSVVWALERNSGTSRVVAPHVREREYAEARSRRREYWRRRTGADQGVVAMKRL